MKKEQASVNLVVKVLECSKNHDRFNLWFENKLFSIYVRKTNRLSDDGVMVKTLDIANITSKKPGKGNFTEFLADLEGQLESYRGFDAPSHIYIENVSDPRFQAFFVKRGYTCTNKGQDGTDTIFGRCYIKRIKET